jgi:hypothetical protein
VEGDYQGAASKLLVMMGKRKQGNMKRIMGVMTTVLRKNGGRSNWRRVKVILVEEVREP